MSQETGSLPSNVVYAVSNLCRRQTITTNQRKCKLIRCINYWFVYLLLEHHKIDMSQMTTWYFSTVNTDIKQQVISFCRTSFLTSFVSSS